LAALAEQLAARDASFEIVVIGGSALVALELIQRSTRDVDIVGLRQGDELVSAKPLPAELQSARDQVARDFRIPEAWLNAGPTDLLDFGLPDGFTHRLESVSYGPALTVHYASRLDQIHFKLYATADGRAVRHEADLRALNPSVEELLQAARWTRTHDPSEGFHEELIKTLRRWDVDVDTVEP